MPLLCRRPYSVLTSKLSNYRHLERIPLRHPALRQNLNTRYKCTLALTAHLIPRPFHSVTNDYLHNPHNRTSLPPQSRSMSSDQAYSSFLDQANQDTGASKASTQSTSGGVSTKTVDTDVPSKLQKVERYYVSEADEPFEPVSLKWSGKNMPSESTSLSQTLYIHTLPSQILIVCMSLSQGWCRR